MNVIIGSGMFVDPPSKPAQTRYKTSGHMGVLYRELRELQRAVFQTVGDVRDARRRNLRLIHQNLAMMTDTSACDEIVQIDTASADKNIVGKCIRVDGAVFSNQPRARSTTVCPFDVGFLPPNAVPLVCSLVPDGFYDVLVQPRVLETERSNVVSVDVVDASTYAIRVQRAVDGTVDEEAFVVRPIDPTRIVSQCWRCTSVARADGRTADGAADVVRVSEHCFPETVQTGHTYVLAHEILLGANQAKIVKRGRVFRFERTATPIAYSSDAPDTIFHPSSLKFSSTMLVHHNGHYFYNVSARPKAYLCQFVLDDGVGSTSGRYALRKRRVVDDEDMRKGRLWTDDDVQFNVRTVCDPLDVMAYRGPAIRTLNKDMKNGKRKCNVQKFRSEGEHASTSADYDVIVSTFVMKYDVELPARGAGTEVVDGIVSDAVRFKLRLNTVLHPDPGVSAYLHPRVYTTLGAWRRVDDVDVEPRAAAVDTELTASSIVRRAARSVKTPNEPAMRFGRRHERDALATLQQCFLSRGSSLSVFSNVGAYYGVFNSRRELYTIRATPDGFVKDENGVIVGVVECKCHQSARHVEGLPTATWVQILMQWMVCKQQHGNLDKLYVVSWNPQSTLLYSMNASEHGHFLRGWDGLVKDACEQMTRGARVTERHWHSFGVPQWHVEWSRSFAAAAQEIPTATSLVDASDYRVVSEDSRSVVVHTRGSEELAFKIEGGECVECLDIVFGSKPIRIDNRPHTRALRELQRDHFWGLGLKMHLASLDTRQFPLQIHTVERDETLHIVRNVDDATCTLTNLSFGRYTIDGITPSLPITNGTYDVSKCIHVDDDTLRVVVPVATGECQFDVPLYVDTESKAYLREPIRFALEEVYKTSQPTSESFTASRVIDAIARRIVGGDGFVNRPLYGFEMQGATVDEVAPLLAQG